MPADLIMGKTHRPSMDEIAAYFEEKAGKLWQEMMRFMEADCKAKPQIAYSVCSGKPGWNVKCEPPPLIEVGASGSLPVRTSGSNLFM